MIVQTKVEASMVQRMTPSQYNAWLRQQEQKQRDAIRKYNQEVDRVNRANKAAHEKQVRDYNREVDRVNQHNKRLVDAHNREVRQENQRRKNAIAKYNQSVRSHNAQVERDRQRRLSALRALTTTHYVEVRDSSFDLSARYDRVEAIGVVNEDILAAAGRESSNSAAVAYALATDATAPPESEQDTGINDYLSDLSQDLLDRWRGALFALNPANTDAARHFCTSVREIFTEILSRWAEDKDVIAADANCEKTQQGTPSRRAKIRFLLKRKGADSPEMLGFVEKDIEDILQLFPVFNKATHGVAGTHSFSSLQALRQRVEGGIMFLATIAS
ncbi:MULTISPECIES: hypothetical protein [Methylorubrum]|uniref:pPIWI-associating nuclease domain-containing protein n=1 Tax=Methylorubrum TaxID=2282523 RepID=UPI00209D53CF|nr:MULTISPECIES: hypothetical protein [Methylorubrum]MCP1551684.1 hypothetical protein [Methylorubrum zatmanii]MCP1556643.1 hypothetical protein [Methylorubrum extorquens]MCP1581732.1 hypothetical protein [Methylorubrum extorquens]